jgi:peptide/nickel transport system permease protein
MIPYIIRRLLWSVVLLLVVSFITFVIFVLLPSADPALLRAGRNPSPEVVAAIRKNLGLDKPWYVQYAIYIRDLVFHFDFGYSYQNNIAVKTTIFDRLPATISLAIGGAVVWLLVGIPIGIISAILTETVFNLPGIGRLAYDAIQKSDLPIVQGTVLLGAFAIIMMNLLVDILYAFLDPRVRY